MRNNKNLYLSIFWIVLGAILSVRQFGNNLESYWSGLGIALLVVGSLQLIKQIKYRTNEQYRENIDIQNSDERYKYIGNKAWAWAGYLYVMIACAAIIVLQILGLREISHMLSLTVCALLILYWVSYMFLRRKY